MSKQTSEFIKRRTVVNGLILGSVGVLTSCHSENNPKTEPSRPSVIASSNTQFEKSFWMHAIVMQKIDAKYEKGSSGPTTFDDVGLVRWSWREMTGEWLPSSTAGIYTNQHVVDKRTVIGKNFTTCNEGDPVFVMDGDTLKTIGIYDGNNSVILASKTDGKVTRVAINQMSHNYTFVVGHWK